MPHVADILASDCPSRGHRVKMCPPGVTSAIGFRRPGPGNRATGTGVDEETRGDEETTAPTYAAPAFPYVISNA